jgi:aspartokinase
MIHTPGVAGQIFGALGGANVNVIAIAQGSSEVSISLVVVEQDVETAVRALHDLIIVNGV